MFICILVALSKNHRLIVIGILHFLKTSTKDYLLPVFLCLFAISKRASHVTSINVPYLLGLQVSFCHIHWALDDVIDNDYNNNKTKRSMVDTDDKYFFGN